MQEVKYLIYFFDFILFMIFLKFFFDLEFSMKEKLVNLFSLKFIKASGNLEKKKIKLEEKEKILLNEEKKLRELKQENETKKQEEIVKKLKKETEFLKTKIKLITDYKKEKTKIKEKNQKLRKILKREKEYRKKFKKTGIATYDEQMETEIKKVKNIYKLKVLFIGIITFSTLAILIGIVPFVRYGMPYLKDINNLQTPTSFTNDLIKKENEKKDNFKYQISETRIISGLDNAINYQQEKIKVYEEKNVQRTEIGKQLINREKEELERLRTKNEEFEYKIKTLEKELSWWVNGKVFLEWFIRINCYLFLIAYFYLNLKKNETLTTHGNSRWATLEDMPKGKKSAQPFSTDLLVPKGVVLGKLDGHTLRDDSKTHILLSAPTRTGKGVSIIIPTLIDTWNESCFVLDIKGENYQLSSGYRKEKFNNKIIRFAPLSSESAKYNPLAEIRVTFEGGLNEAEDISNIAILLAQSDSGGSSDPFWEENGASYIEALITLAIYKIRLDGIKEINKIKREGGTPTSEQILKYNRKASFADINDIQTNPENKMTLQEYFKFLCGMLPNNNKEGGGSIYGVEKGKYIKHFFTPEDEGYEPERDGKLIELLSKIYPVDVETMIKKGIHPNIQKLMSKIVSQSENTFANVKAVADGKLKVFNTPLVKNNTSESDFRIWDLMNYKQPISFYLVIEPNDLIQLAPLARILIIQIINKLTKEQDYIGGGSHKYRLLFMLDEFPAIGKMEILEKAIGFVAGYGMKMVIILQSLQQLFNIYTEKNGIMSNCQVQVFYTANENESAKYISETLGSETITYETKSGKKGIDVLGQLGETRTQRSLLAVSDMRNLPLEKMVIIAGGKPPILTEKIQYFDVPEYAGRTKIPYIISEGLDKIVDYVNIPSEVAYKLEDSKENPKQIPERYEVFYSPEEKIYDLKSSFYRYFKVNYILGYIKEPLICAIHSVKRDNVTKKNNVSGRFFIGNLMNNFNFNKDLSLGTHKLLKSQSDMLIGRTFTKLLNDVKSDDKDKLGNMNNQLIIENLANLSKLWGTEEQELFKKEYIAINSKKVVDFDKTEDETEENNEKKLAEIGFFGSAMYDGVLESLLKLAIDNARLVDPNSEFKGEGTQRIFNRICKSYNDLREFILLDKQINRDTKNDNEKTVLSTFEKIFNKDDIIHYFDEVDVANSLHHLIELRKSRYENIIKQNPKNTGKLGNENLIEKIALDRALNSSVFILAEFSITDPETKRAIKYQGYVPIPLSVIYANKKVFTEKQEQRNYIMRNYIKYLRNNNANWINLAKDVTKSIEIQKIQIAETQLRKSVLKSVLEN